MSAEAIAKAWREAASDLAIEVIAPYQITDSSGYVLADSIALVKHFGSPEGTVIFERHKPLDDVLPHAEAQGRFCSMLDSLSYGRYNRDLFLDTLNDWGWYGDPKQRPTWYTGKSWTDKTSQ